MFGSATAGDFDEESSDVDLLVWTRGHLRRTHVTRALSVRMGLPTTAPTGRQSVKA